MVFGMVGCFVVVFVVLFDVDLLFMIVFFDSEIGMVFFNVMVEVVLFMECFVIIEV